jgi:HNH endonuclease
LPDVVKGALAWCEIHHVKPWEHGGETKLSNLVMICRTHHREMHSSEWIVQIAPDGLPEFYPPAWIDPQQHARRKPLPHLLDRAAETSSGIIGRRY